MIRKFFLTSLILSLGIVAILGAQRPQFATSQGMGGRVAALCPANVQGGGLEVHLLPPKIADLNGSQAMAKGEEDHQRVATSSPRLAFPLRRL